VRLDHLLSKEQETSIVLSGMVGLLGGMPVGGVAWLLKELWTYWLMIVVRRLA
jgi:hypothetical protein